MKSRLRLFALGAVSIGLMLGAASSAEAGWRKPVFRQTASPAQRVRPVTGYGSNLHRRFVIRRELQRAERGLPVRNRGNVLWYRYSR